MAIFYCQMSIVSRGSGRSSVAAAAYRSAQKLTNERDGLVHDYERRQGVQHSEIVLPTGVNADWAKDRSALWNAAERAEKRNDARVAREFVIALPHELTPAAREELTREFARDLANRYGAAVDFAIHQPHPEGDVRNHHAHVMMTTRQITEEGFGAKTYMELANKELMPKGLPSTQMQIVDIRRSWEILANERLALEGHEIRIDHRSHAERGLEIEPTAHVGVRATNIERRGGEIERARLDTEASRKNAELIQEKPEQVLEIISNEKSVFDRYDIARALHRYINDDAQAYQNAFASVMASSALVELCPERMDEQTGEVLTAKYATRDMVDLERGMMDTAASMADARNHGVDRRHVVAAIARQDAAIQKASGNPSAGLSGEQRAAVEHVTGAERISAVVGFAGAGKSTMLAAANEAWEAQGYRVFGAALSGKAAEGLEESSGIKSRTLASWSHGWERGRNQLGHGDVFVIDEAGMVGSRQLANFLGEAEKRGAKIVIVGDHEQLQAIGAGAPFRAISEQIGHAELSDIRRQREDWQRQASVLFATHKTSDALAAYRERGAIQFTQTRDQARADIVRDYLADRDQRPEGSRVAMAHRRADVRAINEAIRSELKDRGELAQVELAPEAGKTDRIEVDEARGQVPARAFTYQTNDGKRDFAEGDRIVFLENNRDLGVKNGMLGTVERVEANLVVAQLDGKEGDIISIPTDSYQAIDHGYATTIHKNQGATVDRAFVMASGTMDRHLTYVAMTRHRDSVQLYASAEEFSDRTAGKLVEHGVAPYEHKDGNRDSYFVTLENAKGEQVTTWGVDLKRAMQEAAPEQGDRIALRHEGMQPVRLPDGTETHRNSWSVENDSEQLSYKQLASRLSRSGAKETTLDYPREFAERRGMAEAFGVKSEIDVPVRSRELRAERDSQIVDRVLLQKRDADLEQGPKSDDGELSPQAERQEQPLPTRRRGMFDGLRLKAGRGAQAARSERESGGTGVNQVERDRLAERTRPMSNFEQAIDGYARAINSVVRQKEEGLPVLEAQSRELRQARERLDQARPGSSDLLRSAIQHDQRMVEALAGHSGRERVGKLVAGMEHERRLQADPNVRADRFIERWNTLNVERQQLPGWQNDKARGEVEGKMRELSAGVKEDPQLEAKLTSRSKEMGIDPVRQERDISSAMERQVSKDRDQGMER